MVRVYVHFETPLFAAECAAIVTVEATTRARDAIQAALQHYAATTKTTLSGTYELNMTDGAALADDKTLHDLVHDMDDLFIVPSAKPVEPAKPATAAATAPATSTSVTAAAAAAAAPAAPAAPAAAASTGSKSSDDDTGSTKPKKNEHLPVVRKEELLEKLRTNPKNVRALRELGSIYINARRYDRALPHLLKAVELDRWHVDTRYKTAEAHYLLADPDYEAVVELLQPLVDRAQATDDVKVLLARAYRKLGQRQPAVQLYEQVLQLSKFGSDPGRAVQESHFEAMLDYGDLAAERGDIEHALSVYLRLLPRDQDHPELGRQLAKVLDDQKNFLLIEEPVRESGASLAFLATIIKNHGALNSSMALMQQALALRPDSTTYALATLHSFELCNKLKEGVFNSRDMLDFNRELTVGPLSCEMLLNTWDGVMTTIPAPMDREEQYIDSALEVVASWFTIVKMIFLSGDLHPVKPMTELLNVIRHGVGKNFHLTLIRNEHAYFSCTYDLMHTGTESLTWTPEERKNNRKLYVLGDSHVLPIAWRKIKVGQKGLSYICEPKLVTGLKCWHLRKSCDFYTKAQFQILIKSIPEGSPVLFVLGEIDCREGLLLAVEKCRYETLEEGMQATVEIYIKTLKELQSQYRWRIFVHPVNPVLNETRRLVLMFNNILRTKLKSASGLTWVDGLVDKLLDPVDNSLKPEYNLDGTHLHPSYLRVLESCLSQTSLSNG